MPEHLTQIPEYYSKNSNIRIKCSGVRAYILFGRGVSFPDSLDTWQNKVKSIQRCSEEDSEEKLIKQGEF